MTGTSKAVLSGGWNGTDFSVSSEVTYSRHSEEVVLLVQTG